MFKKSAVRTSTLVTKPSFLYGIGRAVDLGGTFNSYNRSESGAEADRRAIADDWKVVGEDLERAMTTR